MARSDTLIQDLIKDSVEGFLLDAHTQMRGNVISYDESTHTCEIKLAAKRPVPDGEGGHVFQEIPNIPNVPVAWPSAGGFILHWPLAVGDSVFVTFDEVDVQRWEGTGEVCEPGWLERFGLSSPLAHPYSRATIATAGANMVCPSPFSFGTAAAAQFVALAPKVDAAWAALFSAMAALPAGPLAGAALSTAFATLAGAYLPSAAGKLKSE
jgi:protein gp138